MKKIAVIGSREYKNVNKIINFIKSLSYDVLIVTGGARGVDKIAEATAKKYGKHYCVVYANWDFYGRSQAGKIRNSIVVKLVDEVYVFWDGKSTGTKDVIDKAKKVNKLKEVFKDE